VGCLAAAGGGLTVIKPCFAKCFSIDSNEADAGRIKQQPYEHFGAHLSGHFPGHVFLTCETAWAGLPSGADGESDPITVESRCFAQQSGMQDGAHVCGQGDGHRRLCIRWWRSFTGQHLAGHIGLHDLKHLPRHDDMREGSLARIMGCAFAGGGG